jgi:hypothetical protein
LESLLFIFCYMTIPHERSRTNIQQSLYQIYTQLTVIFEFLSMPILAELIFCIIHSCYNILNEYENSLYEWLQLNEWTIEQHQYGILYLHLTRNFHTFKPRRIE